MQLIYNLCPHAIPLVEVLVPKTSEFEGHFAQVNVTNKFGSAPILFLKVEEVMGDVFKIFRSVAADGKLPAAGLHGKKKLYEVPNAEILHKQTPLNKDLPRIKNNVSNKRSTNMSLEELGKMERYC